MDPKDKKLGEKVSPFHDERHHRAKTSAKNY